MWNRSALSSHALIAASALLAFGLWFVTHSWGHEVGEPDLEKTTVWQSCCGGGDCIPKPVKLINKAAERNNMVVKIDGIETAVAKEKFSPVPSNRTWVCYVDPNAAISNENIRCILYPEKGGTT